MSAPPSRPPTQRVLSGMQPSGLLHLGNLLGALDNWKALQDQYDCFFFVADWHALSTNYADTSRIREFTREMLLDWLAGASIPSARRCSCSPGCRSTRSCTCCCP